MALGRFDASLLECQFSGIQVACNLEVFFVLVTLVQ